MENRPEIRDFLMSRRSRVTPEQAGLPSFGNRRVAGLRRNEAAALAGVSVEYYTRAERGNLQGVSESVLDAIANALRMDETERSHLHDLARIANSSPTKARQRSTQHNVPGAVRRVVDGLPALPAYVQNNRFDILYANPLAKALFSEMYEDPSARENTLRFVFYSPAARRFYIDWDKVARTGAGSLRVQAGRNPYDTDLSNLIGELSTRSDAFRVMWGSNDVGAFVDSGTKNISHPVVGELRLEHSTMALPGDGAMALTVYSAPPGTPTEDGLTMLASWTATARIASVEKPGSSTGNAML